jgi:hypothetical protein
VGEPCDSVRGERKWGGALQVHPGRPQVCRNPEGGRLSHLWGHAETF